MNPIADVAGAESGFALGDFILVVGEYVIHAAGMDVKRFAQVFGGHRGTFDMPAGETGAPGAIPFNIAAGFGGFPQGEIAGVALQGVGFGADACQQVGAGVAG